MTADCANAPWIDVAAGVLFREDGCFLLGQRAQATFCPGYWEFPGGKLEQGETAAEALVRELREELGIRVQALHPWLVRKHRYAHACVRLHFFTISAWEGEPKRHVHQALAWQRPGELGLTPMLPANAAVLKALSLPRVMGISGCAHYGQQVQLLRLAAALDSGLRLIMVREPKLDECRLRSFIAELKCLSAAYDQVMVMLNGPVSLVQEFALAGVHLKSVELMNARTRPDFAWVGASCHDRQQLEKAAQLGLDYVLLGSVNASDSHPGEAGMGWLRFGELVRELPMPVLALGGVSRKDMATACSAGAHGVAGIRGIWTSLG